jgi:hypothetical protein
MIATGMDIPAVISGLRRECQISLQPHQADMINKPCERSLEEYDRYAHFETDSGNVVMYDRENSNAWLLSDTSSFSMGDSDK